MIFTPKKNSPARAYYHYEDGAFVTSCTKGSSGNAAYTRYTTSTNSRYFNPSPGYASGSYAETVIWTYTVDSSRNATITGYNGYASAVAIPSEIDGYTVTKIGYPAFRNNAVLRSVVIPDTVTEIGRSAFENCIKLTDVKLSKSLDYLGLYAFSGCNKLTSIEIPKSLNSAGYAIGGTSVGGGSFSDTGLVSVTFEEGTSKIASEQADYFQAAIV